MVNRRVRLKRIYCFLLCLCFTSCTGNELRSDIILSKEKAISIACQAVVDKHPDMNLDNYVISTADDKSEWIILFDYNDPSPPGEGLYVHVNKNDFSIKIFYNE